MAQLYFAYGSNLDNTDWAAWCARNGFDPGCIEAIGPAVLPDVELVFDYHSQGRSGGVLNLRPRVGQCVDGMLFEVSEVGNEALDTKEGAPYVYRRQTRRVIRADGAAVAAFVYEVCPERRCGFTAPHDLYLEVCRRGRERHGLDTRMLAQVARDEAAEYAVSGIFVHDWVEVRFRTLAATGRLTMTTATARGTLLDFGQRPVLGDQATVYGEYGVPADLEATLAEIDLIEGAEPRAGIGGPYRRTLMTVDVGGQACRAWTYVLGEQGQRQIGIKRTALVAGALTRRQRCVASQSATAGHKGGTGAIT